MNFVAAKRQERGGQNAAKRQKTGFQKPTRRTKRTARYKHKKEHQVNQT